MSYLIIMRGVPGSGKSTLARQLADAFKCHICSADDFHIIDGEYRWRAENTQWAHGQCLNLCESHILANDNVIIDNTNTKRSDYTNYIKLAKIWNYDILIAEPDNSWSSNVEECANRNVHGVKFDTIKKMHANLSNQKLQPQEFPVIHSVEEAKKYIKQE